jgi:hypothetical protein
MWEGRKVDGESWLPELHCQRIPFANAKNLKPQRDFLPWNGITQSPQGIQRDADLAEVLAIHYLDPPLVGPEVSDDEISVPQQVRGCRRALCNIFSNGSQTITNVLLTVNCADAFNMNHSVQMRQLMRRRQPWEVEVRLRFLNKAGAYWARWALHAHNYLPGSQFDQSSYCVNTACLPVAALLMTDCCCPNARRTNLSAELASVL